MATQTSYHLCRVASRAADVAEEGQRTLILYKVCFNYDAALLKPREVFAAKFNATTSLFAAVCRKF